MFDDRIIEFVDDEEEMLHEIEASGEFNTRCPICFFNPSYKRFSKLCKTPQVRITKV